MKHNEGFSDELDQLRRTKDLAGTEGMSDSQPLDDTDPMPFGKYKGLPMQDVPANYLHYLWHNGLKHADTAVAEYVRKNLDALRAENTDLIWT